MFFCQQCGTTYKEGAGFCHKCGLAVKIESARSHNESVPLLSYSKPRNKQKSYAYAWLFVTLLFLLCMILPFVAEIDIMNGGGAMVFVGALMFITGLIVTPFFFKRAKRFNEIVSGKNTIVHWTYTGSEWAQYTEEEFKRRKAQSWGIFALITSIMFVVFLIMGFILDDALPFMIVLFLCMTLIMFLSAWLSYIVPYRRNKKRIGEAIIAPSGIYLNGSIHIWQGLSARFERVMLEENDTILVFTYSALVQYGRREEYSVNVPVPQGKLNEAIKVIGIFNQFKK